MATRRGGWPRSQRHGAPLRVRGKPDSGILAFPVYPAIRLIRFILWSLCDETRRDWMGWMGWMDWMDWLGSPQIPRFLAAWA
eukprot:12744855-Alexandrium_andersonii.AAC.1